MQSFKPLYFLLGWIFFGTGVVGAFLPVLPTTPFMLLALWMFSKSSDRFHHWLYNHRVFGPPLQRWQQHHVIPWTAKLAAVGMMIFSFVLMLLFRDWAWWIYLLIGAVMLYGIGFVMTKPSYPPQTDKPSAATMETK
jgi:uncharacterized membrane protein YbaN (DUF454 family)